MQSGSFRPVDVPGREAPPGPFSSDDVPLVNNVDPSFLTLMRMRLVAGRLFTGDENREGADRWRS